MAIIEDGTGSGKWAKVNLNNRLLAQVITESEADHAAEVGDRYNINTGDITLTSANESGVFYIKNNEDDDLIVPSLIFNLGASTGGSGDWLASVYRNPTAGTVVSDASAVSMNANMNFGSNKTLVVDAYKGGEGKTLTDGTLAIESRVSGGRVIISLGTLAIPKGFSIGVKFTPPTSNTSAIVNCAASCYLKTDDVSGGSLS